MMIKIATMPRLGWAMITTVITKMIPSTNIDECYEDDGGTEDGDNSDEDDRCGEHDNTDDLSDFDDE